MEDIFEKVPCREEQLKDLFDLFGDYGEPLPPSLFISGNMGTGKTLCVETVLMHLGYTYVTVDCIECYSPKLMYEVVLSSLEGTDVTVKSDSLLEFMNGLERVQGKFETYNPIVIILDRAERLRSMDHNIICALLTLREQTNLNICTVFITHLLFENFEFKMGIREPIQLFFPNYSKEELFKIIFLQHKSFVSQAVSEHQVDSAVVSEIGNTELFANFLNAFLSVFYRPCRDLIELQHMAQVNFVKYCEPIIRKEIRADDLARLWRHISPILKTSLQTLYLRICDSTNDTQSSGKENANNIEKTLGEELTSTKTFAQSFELPYYAKYLLIAAYLASYNPPKEDKRLFMKNHGKQRKRLQQVKSKAKIHEKLSTQLGPKVFTLDRLLAIFYAILEEKIGLTSNLLAQIATLVELKLLAGSKEIDLDASKYKCIVGYDFILAVAQTVRFNVKKYLYDFI